MHAKLSKDEFKNYGSNADAFLTTTPTEIKGLIAKEVDRVHTERTQAEVQLKSTKPLVTCSSSSTVPHRAEIKQPPFRFRSLS